MLVVELLVVVELLLVVELLVVELVELMVELVVQ